MVGGLGSLAEKAMAPHSSTLAWKIPWTEEPGRLQSMGLLESDTTERLLFYFSLSCIGEGNGNPLQYSCLENPVDRGAGGLLSIGSHRVGHDWSDLAAAAAEVTKHRTQQCPSYLVVVRIKSYDHLGILWKCRSWGSAFPASSQALVMLQIHPPHFEVCVLLFSRVQLFATPQTVAWKALLSIGFSP